MNLVIILAIVGIILLIEYLRDCDHDWKIIRAFDILEFNDAGYPKMLCLLQCQNCKMMKLEFVEIPPEFVKVRNMHNIAWSIAEDDFEIGGLHV